MLVGDHESDAVLEFLHNCSQQLLEANIESTEQSDPIGIEANRSDPNREISELESIHDLIQFPHSIHTTDGLQNNNRIDCKTLSPLSCDNDSGYESANSPQIAFNDRIDDPMDEAMDDIHWRETLSELFPDLI